MKPKFLMLHDDNFAEEMLSKVLIEKSFMVHDKCERKFDARKQRLADGVWTKQDYVPIKKKST